LAARPDASVAIVEGEGKADAAQQLLPDWCCVSFGSSKAVKNTDWSPLLNRDTRQVIWRDNDANGLKAQADVLSQLKGRAEVIDMDPAWRERWDLADALREGWDTTRTLAYLTEHSHPAIPATELQDASTLDFTHDSMALRFTEQYGADLRYIAMWGQWFNWQGNVWKRDETLHVFDLIRDLCRHQAPLAETKEMKRMLKDARTVTSVERMAQSDRQHAATTYQWDANIMLLNTPDGVVDLETGKLRPNDRQDYCTKITAVSPVAKADCPNWQVFLKKVMNNSEDMVQFIQRMTGYMLTGSIN
jgi:putative DNA primase/helicase